VDKNPSVLFVGETMRNGDTEPRLSRGDYADPSVPSRVRQGLTGTVRRWAVFLSIAIVDSTLYLVHSWGQGNGTDSWWGSRTLLWVSLALVTSGGMVWSWCRWRAGGSEGEASSTARHALTSYKRRTEVILLWVLAFAYAALAGFPTRPPEPGSAVRVLWTFEQAERGAIISSPLVAGDRVYVGAIRDSAFAPSGVVYCLNRATGKVVWKFDDEGAMMHMYSSPCLGDGRLYIGEGMHGNLTSKLYCLDAASGQKQWHFETAGHVESSPCLADGKVFFGAGDDGIYCLDVASGQQRWHFKGPVHIDSSAAVAGQRLYAGSGVSRAYRSTEVLCLACEDGKVLWRTPTDLPVWGSPVVAGDQLFVGLGNGRLGHSAEPPEKPSGAVLCLDAQTGQVCWRYDVDDAILVRPALGSRLIYVSSRDGNCYGIHRKDGRLCWRESLGSPVVAAPTLVGQRLYLAASGGQVCCLDAETGKRHWSFDVAAQSQMKPQLFSTPAVTSQDEEGAGDRRVYLGAELRSAISSTAVLYCLQD
jgi:outer membrane protein assembly factor BamB